MSQHIDCSNASPPNSYQIMHSSFHKNSALLLGLVKHPCCDSSRPWPIVKKKQNGVWKFIMSANIHDSIGFLTFFSEKLHRCFPIAQESCCWFISILSLSHLSWCLLWCHCTAHANTHSRFISLDFATYPASWVGVYHQDSMKSQLGMGEQHKSSSQLIKFFFFFFFLSSTS